MRRSEVGVVGVAELRTKSAQAEVFALGPCVDDALIARSFLIDCLRSGASHVSGLLRGSRPLALMLLRRLEPYQNLELDARGPLVGFFQSTDRPRHITPSSPSQFENSLRRCLNVPLPSPFMDARHAPEVDRCHRSS